MSSLRQKPKLSFETPVLFRLPDLRARQAHTVIAWPSAKSPEPAGVSADTNPQSFRVDPAQSVTPAASISHMAKSDVTPQSELTATGDPASPVAVIASNTPVSQAGRSRSSTIEASVSGQPVRGWMERFGSPLILVVTILVIVTAAWVTGQRVPAGNSIDSKAVVIAEDSQSLVDSLSKTDFSKLGDAESQQAQRSPVEQSVPVASSKESTLESTTIPPANVVAKPALDQSLAKSAAGSSVPLQPAQEMSATLALEAPRSVHDDLLASLADAPPETVSGPLLAPPVPPQAAVSPFTPVQSVAHDMSARFSTEPAAAMALVPATGGGFYAGNEGIEVLPSASQRFPSATSSQPTNKQASPVVSTTESTTPSSSTPNQLKIDPNVLVPWANEQVMNHARQQSITPNPIRNWNDYLPVSGSSNVRAATANIDPQLQPQVGMPAVGNSPAFSNSFYSN